MTRVLIDRHHHALLESLLILFEDRGILGPTEVYSPFGMEWFEQEYWNFERKWHGDKVARQYLTGVWGDAEPHDGIVRVPDVRHPGRVHKGVTLDTALDTHWDVVISSLPHNDEGYHRLARQTGAHFGVQVGNNVQQSRWDLAEFILSSSTLPDAGLVAPETWSRPVTAHGRPAVIYHQEFSLEHFRAEWPPADRRTVASFVNCFPEGPSYPEFLRFARTFRNEFDFKVYGASGRPSWWSQPGPYVDEFQARDISWVPDVAEAMRAARTFWFAKHWSDGYGHVVHSQFCVGRPVVGIPRYYADKLAGPLFIEGVTSFDIERRSPDELAMILRRLRDDDDLHRQMSEAAAARFRQVVDFDADADAIAAMFSLVLR